MWKRPDNIPTAEWDALSKAWDAKKAAVYKRFATYAPAMETDKIDEMMSGLLGVYYGVEIHTQQNADWITQWRDEFRKGKWVEQQIQDMLRDHPELREKAIVHFDGEEKELTLADKCMGGIVRAFIEMTGEVCRERFGQPFTNPRTGEHVEKGVRNGIPEKGFWKILGEEYTGKLRTLKAARKDNPDAPPPPMYRQ